jgi:hypothetical protein
MNTPHSVPDDRFDSFPVRRPRAMAWDVLALLVSAFFMLATLAAQSVLSGQ